MEKLDTIQNINNFIHTNREELLKRAIDIKDLPIDDAWIQDDEWDEIYKQGVVEHGKV